MQDLNHLVELYESKDSLYRHAASDVQTGVDLYRINTGAGGCAAAADERASGDSGAFSRSSSVCASTPLATALRTIDVGQSESTAAVTTTDGTDGGSSAVDDAPAAAAVLKDDEEKSGALGGGVSRGV